MENEAPDPPDTAAPTDPPADRAGRAVPARIALLLHAVRILLGFGRHLADTAQHRATRPGFNAIAVCFGTSRLHRILAHLQRGILRAMALERVLLARAAQGRDIRLTEPRTRMHVASAAPADPSAPPPPEAQTAPEASAAAVMSATVEAPGARPATPRPTRPPGWNDPELFMPTLEELEAQVRRRPLGRTIVEICLDLAVVPGFCAGAFWNTLFDSIRLYGGSLDALRQERTRRQEAFCKEQDLKPGSDWSWLEMTRDGLLRVLGFRIGEAPVDPFEPAPGPGVVVATAATGPP
jgi:hypothetical protein